MGRYNMHVLIWTFRLSWPVLYSILDTLVKMQKREFLYVKHFVISVIFSHHLTHSPNTEVSKFFSIKGQTVNIFGFAGSRVSAPTIQL